MESTLPCKWLAVPNRKCLPRSEALKKVSVSRFRACTTYRRKLYILPSKVGANRSKFNGTGFVALRNRNPSLPNDAVFWC